MVETVVSVGLAVQEHLKIRKQVIRPLTPDVYKRQPCTAWRRTASL